MNDKSERIDRYRKRNRKRDKRKSDYKRGMVAGNPRYQRTRAKVGANRSMSANSTLPRIPKDKGIDEGLRRVVQAVDHWCRNNRVSYDIACDESDLQGIKLFQKNRPLLNSLLDHISPFIEHHNIHLETQKVRGGTILAFSLKALSESRFNSLIAEIGEEVEAMSFQERIDDAMNQTPVPTMEQETSSDLYSKLLESAKKMVKGKDDSDEFDTIDREESQTKKGGSHGATLGSSKGATLRFEDKVSTALSLRPDTDRHRYNFNHQLREALGGIATPSDAQPGDLFAKFAKALQVLGDQMGVGPLQDRLKEQGIRWKKSDDGQSIILYIVNAQTNAPQPIARITAETLDKPNDFEEQLTHMLDFAQGDAPGAFKQEQERIRNQEKAVREIARAVSPQQGQESEVAQQMQSQAAGPAAPTQPATVTAPRKAATPK